MKKSTLISNCEKKAQSFEYFPNTASLAIFRLWGICTTEQIAKALDATVEEVKNIAGLMGLEKEIKAPKIWRERGYITMIRDVWHLFDMEQICILLDIDMDELDFILKEDDFLWVKLGSLKPVCEKAKITKPTEADLKAYENIKNTLAKYKAEAGNPKDNAFEFIDNFYHGKIEGVPVLESDGGLKMIYSYFALYGDPLINEELDPFPEKLLEEYARYGVNGIWMQGVLYQLVPYPFKPELSKGWEKRIENLNKLIAKAKKYGIGVYLYFNEPRSMSSDVFEKYPHLKGHVRDEKSGSASMCTSTPEVKEYLENATYELFSRAKGLAGFFTITASENQTNCYSHSTEKTCNCPRCKERSMPEVLAEVNNLLARGMKRADPSAKAIAWVWGWPDNRVEKVLENLDKDIIFQSTSETHLPINKGGVDSEIVDYTMSNCGPSEWAKNNWKMAKKKGIECSAKVQFNNTWEISGVPYIPCYSLVRRHIMGLKDAGVRHFMLSWTLGGSPSPTLKLTYDMLKSKENISTEDFIRSMYGRDEADTVIKAEKELSEGFGEFPFHVQVAYCAPQTSGPKSPFFPKPTDYAASMVCYPYDDLDGWRWKFPREVFISQFGKVTEGFEKSLATLKAYKGERTKLFDEFYNCTECCLVHFKTNYNLSRFVDLRDKFLAGDNSVKDEILSVIDSEKENVENTIKLQSRDSRMGYEASNHYNFSQNDLWEKLINIDYTRKFYE